MKGINISTLCSSTKKFSANDREVQRQQQVLWFTLFVRLVVRSELTSKIVASWSLHVHFISIMQGVYE